MLRSHDSYFEAHLTVDTESQSRPRNANHTSYIPGSVEYGPCDERTWNRQSYWHKYGSVEKDVSLANQMVKFEMMCDAEHLSEVPHIYHELFHRTRKFATTVKELVDATLVHAPHKWSQAACLLVNWSVNILRHEKVGFEKFLQSQRESIYWILDDALLRICLDRWEDHKSKSPWDKTTMPLRLALSEAHENVSEWGDRDLEEMRKWTTNLNPSKEEVMRCYFKKSQMFLSKSIRMYELWRTLKLWGKGQLPVELAAPIIEDVSMFEGLPTQGFRELFSVKGKQKALE